jgi:hypothetical protein
VATAISVTDLPARFAKGSLTYGAAAELKFAAAFVDQKDQRKPIGLVISDQKLPVEKWESEGLLLLPANFPGARIVTPKFKP